MSVDKVGNGITLACYYHNAVGYMYNALFHGNRKLNTKSKCMWTPFYATVPYYTVCMCVHI